MRSIILAGVVVLGTFSLMSGNDELSNRRVAIEWRGGRPHGVISVTKGTLVGLRVARGQGVVESSIQFRATQDGPFRLELDLTGSEARYGPEAALVTVAVQPNPFTFLLRDARKQQPVFVPVYGVAVTDASDQRSYEEIAAAIRARGLQSKLEQVESEPEENWDNAAHNTRRVNCQTWLGLSRDMRIFSVGERLEWIQPRFHGMEARLPETGNKPVRYNFLMGRGWGAYDKSREGSRTARCRF